MRRRALGIFALIIGALALTSAVLGWQADRHMPASPTTTTVTATTISTVGHPLPSVTPGVVLTTSKADVCTPGWASKHRHGLSAKQKATVLAAYGYPAGQKVAEWDHLVSLELGGGNGIRNIWPETSDPDQARKDRLENALHRKVCTGQLTLTEAQAEIRQFWLFW